MAFVSRIGSILKQARSKQINIESSVSNLSLYQAVRCMSTKLFVGGLPYGTDEASLRQVFAQYGEVDDVRIISDRDTGRSRGFGFVSFFSSEDASTAMQSMDGQAIQGRTVRVNIAADKPRAGGFGGGGEYGGGGYGENHGGGGGYRGGSSSNAGGYGNYGSGGVGSYTGGNSGRYGGVSSSGNFGLAGGSNNNFSFGNSAGNFGGSDYTEAKYGDRMGIGGVNESFSQDPPEGKDRNDNGEPDEFANTRG